MQSTFRGWMVMLSGKPVLRIVCGSLLAATVLCAVLLGAPLARSASGCSRASQLAYVAASGPGERGMVWLARANGSRRQRLFRAATPVLAPGGRLISVTKFGSSSGLGIFTVCGGMVHRYFSARDGISGVVWSPDASLLAAIVAPHPNGNDVFNQRLVVINVATGTTTTVATGFLNGFGGPSFSPAAPYRVAYDLSPHVGAHFNVWSATIGQPGVQLTHEGDNQYPLWAPQGILYSHVSSSGATVLDLIGAAKPSTLMKLNGWPVAISSNGRRLVAEGAACGVIWPLTVDLGARKVVRKLANGFAPFGISASGRSVLIAGSPPVGDCGGKRSRIETAGFAHGKPALVAYGTDPSWAGSAAVNVLGG